MDLQKASHTIYLSLLAFKRMRGLLLLHRGLPAAHVSPTLSNTDFLILLILESKSNLTIKDLAEQVGLERSWVSRIVGRLEKDGFIKIRAGEHDKRSKQLRIIKKGEKELSKGMQIEAEVMRESLAKLDNVKTSKLLGYVRLLSDQLHASNFLEHPEGDPLILELMRLSGAAKLQSSNFLNTGLPLAQVEILHFIETRQSFNMSVMVRYFPFDQSTLSRMVKQLAEQGYLVKNRSNKDGRAFDLSLTTKGRTVTTTFTRETSLFFASALAAFSEHEIRDFIEILASVTEGSPLEESPLPSQLSVSKLKKSESSKVNFAQYGLAVISDNDRDTAVYSIVKDCKVIGYITKNKKDSRFSLGGALNSSIINWALAELER